MSTTVTLPLWIFLVLLALAAWAALERLVLPSARWYLRRRVNRIIDELNERLQLRIQPFKLTKRQVLIERLMYDTEVANAAHAYAAERGMRHGEVMAEVARFTREIVPSFNAYAYFRVGYWIAKRVAQALYRVRLGYADDVGLSRVDPNASVVFVMNHRSNMDYVLVTYLVADRAALSYAVGEWARVWPLQTLVRTLGAYFVRRDSGDPLYRKVLARYVTTATEGGVVQALYPEGALSVDGAMRPAKLGLLGYIFDAFDPGAERDVVFVPVGVNYDRVLEDRTQLRKQGGATTRRSTAFVLRTTASFALRNLSLWLRRRWYRLGYAGVGLGTPVSLRAYCAESGLGRRRPEGAERQRAVAQLAEVLMAGIRAMVPVLPVSLVATVFVRAGEQALSELEVKASAARLVESLRARGAHVYVPRSDADYAVTVGLRMLVLRGAVLGDDGLFHAALEERALLEYYARSIEHFLEPAGVAASPGRGGAPGPRR